MGYRWNPFVGNFDRVDGGTALPDVETLQGNSGGKVGPDGTFNIDILGDNTQGINIVGTPGSNLLTVSGIDTTTSQKGVVELATSAETITGTDTARANTPAGLAAKLGAQTANSLTYGGGTTAALNWLGEATNGQLPIGSTGNPPVLASLTQPAAGVTITGGAGSITFALADDLAAVEGLATTGLATRTASNTWTTRTIIGGIGITVTNGDGVSGNPTISTTNGGAGTGQTIGAVTDDLITIDLGAAPGTFTISASVAAFETSTPAGAGYRLTAMVRTTGATGALIGAVTQIIQEEAALAAGTATIVVAGNTAIIRSTGTAALTVEWSATSEYVFAS